MPPAVHPQPEAKVPPPSPAMLDFVRALARMMAAEQFAADQAARSEKQP